MDFYNRNKVNVFNMNIGTSITQLSAFSCIDAIIINRTGGDLYVYQDINSITDDRRMLLEDNESFLFKGITNSNNLSASASSAGVIYVQTQYYSNTPSR